jgi:hypothetical protein
MIEIRQETGLTRQQSAPNQPSALPTSTTTTTASSVSPSSRRRTARPTRTASRNVSIVPFQANNCDSDIDTRLSSLPPRPLRNRMRRPQALQAAPINDSRAHRPLSHSSQSTFPVVEAMTLASCTKHLLYTTNCTIFPFCSLKP